MNTKKSKNISSKEKNSMQDLLAKVEIDMPQAGELIKGVVIKKSKNAVIIDLGPIGTGIIYGGELKEVRTIFRDLKVGQEVSGLVIDPENEDGYVELSLKEAALEKGWTILKDKYQTDEIISVKVTEANRGGLVIEIEGIVGFLPVSQLSTANYPRVEGGDKNKILSHLNQFVGKEMEVKIIGLDQKKEKFIVSEKAIEEKEIKENLKHYKAGDVVEGTVTGLTDFGAFIKFGDNLEGLAHISELDWKLINHPNQVLRENENIKAQIINIQGGQVFLSLKALKEDPWKEINGKLESGQTIKGSVTKISPFGALIKVEDKNVYGLAHISEFNKKYNNQPIENIIQIGQTYDFEILSIEPRLHKMFLTLKK